MVEKVAILGAGIAGLCSALALAGPGRDIVLLERDPPPPDGGADEAFADWPRRGVGHLRQSHAFLARLRSLIAAEHPELLDALRDAGARDLGFAQGLPETLKALYRPWPGDEDMAVIISRRTTLEMVIRRYVQALPGVTLSPDSFVSGLVGETAPDGAFHARGFRLQNGESVEADLLIDAGGWTSPVFEWLAEAGVAVPEAAEGCAILYYTRFYRLLPGQEEPVRGPHGTTGDLGYIKFAVFPADNDTFSITIAVPEVEEALRAGVVDPERWEAICAAMPGIAPWTDPARSEPVSRVHGMGQLESRWRDFAPGGRSLVLGLFPVGDSLVRTNPLYGRGCSFAAVEAHLLRDVLKQTADPAERARLYADAARRELRPYYDDMVVQDRGAARRAISELDPSSRPSLRGRVLRGFLEDGVAIALRQDLSLLRQAMRAFHMLEPPRRWLSRPATLAKILAVWARGRRANARFYAPKAGPDRIDMFVRLGLDPQADPRRLGFVT